MHIEISYRSLSRSDALDDHVSAALEHEVGRFDDRLTRIEVHLSDENADKPGPNDKRCLLEARPKGLDPLVVEHHGEDLYTVITEAAGKLRRALTHKFEKLDAKS